MYLNMSIPNCVYTSLTIIATVINLKTKEVNCDTVLMISHLMPSILSLPSSSVGSVGIILNQSLLDLPMLRLLSSDAQERKYFWKQSKPCHVGTHWTALTDDSQMSTHIPWFQWFFRIFALFFIGQTANIAG